MSEYSQDRKGFWYEAGDVPTSETVALEAWVRIAHDVLLQTAGTYHAVVPEAELAEELQSVSGIRTTRPPERWLGKVLGPLSRYCEQAGQPPLDSLVVGPADDLRSARLRLECYRWAGAAPADGGEPEVHSAPRRTRSRAPGGTPSGTSSRAPSGPSRPARTPAAPPRTARTARTDRPVAICPSCFMALPATGVCDTCQ